MNTKYKKYLKYDLKLNDRIKLVCFSVKLCKCSIVIKYIFAKIGK